jgi:hypothetical protein
MYYGETTVVVFLRLQFQFFSRTGLASPRFASHFEFVCPIRAVSHVLSSSSNNQLVLILIYHVAPRLCFFASSLRLHIHIHIATDIWPLTRIQAIPSAWLIFAASVNVFSPPKFLIFAVSVASAVARWK